MHQSFHRIWQTICLLSLVRIRNGISLVYFRPIRPRHTDSTDTTANAAYLPALVLAPPKSLSAYWTGLVPVLGHLPRRLSQYSFSAYLLTGGRDLVQIRHHRCATLRRSSRHRLSR